MCGIVGIASKSNCIQEVIVGTQALEYRGYDSSGIAFTDGNQLLQQKSFTFSAVKSILFAHK